ncbi:MAG: hypothetical protein AB1847_07615 [bacterium]
MSDYSSQYYLVIRPLAEDPSIVDLHLESLSAATGLDKMTLKQKLTGTALRVLKVHQDQAVLEELSRKLGGCGLLSSAIISKSELGGVKKPLRCSSIEIGQRSITFLSAQSGEILSLDSSQSCLLVLSTGNFKRLQGKRLARLAMNTGTSYPVSESLSYIFRNNPMMDIYVDGFDTAVRIDSTKFNYSCLGQSNKYTTFHNFPVIMKEIGRICPSTMLDIGLGENELPFLDLTGEDVKWEQEFTLYSSFISLARQKGIFTAQNGNGNGNGKGEGESTDTDRGTDKGPVLDGCLSGALTGKNALTIENMNGIIWAGPFLLSGKNHNQKPVHPGIDEVTAQEAFSLPSPPEGIAPFRSSQMSAISFLPNFLRGDRRWIKTLGPPSLVYPLGFLAIISFGLALNMKSLTPLPLGFLSLGLIFFIHSFVLLQRKKTIENCPTSRIRSMPMGQVELKGYARQKYCLKSPYTFTDCVYYAYKIYEKVKTDKGQREILREYGHSGSIPFYLEDETGRVLILPDKATINAGITQSMWGDPIVKIFGASPSCTGDDKKIVETVVPTGQFLYVFGFARRLKTSIQEKKKRMIEKLRSLKENKDLLKEYDLDRDGTISQEEWDMARKGVEEEILLEELSSKDTNDRVAVGEHPSGGFFYISDKQEECLLGSMSWKIPLFLILGIAGIAGGTLYLVKFFQDKALLQELMHVMKGLVISSGKIH